MLIVSNIARIIIINGAVANFLKDNFNQCTIGLIIFYFPYRPISRFIKMAILPTIQRCLPRVTQTAVQTHYYARWTIKHNFSSGSKHPNKNMRFFIWLVHTFNISLILRLPQCFLIIAKILIFMWESNP